MNKAMSTTLTGVAVTMAVGGAAYMLNNKKNKRKVKKNATKAVKAVGHFVDNISYIFK